MSRKTLIYICMTIGSGVGGFMPSIWGDGAFSMWATVLAAVGGFGGIWIGYRISKML